MHNNDTPPARRPGFQVGPSALNAVKFELAVILLWAVVLLVAVEFITPRPAIQIVVLAGFAIAAAIWLIVRTRRALIRARREFTDE